MNKTSVRKNDLVIVIRGKDRGKTGKVLKVIPETSRAIVEKVNLAKHFVRADRSRNVQGGVMEKEAAVHVSNLLLYCGECSKGVRARNKVLEDGSKIRVCGRCEAIIERQK